MEVLRALLLALLLCRQPEWVGRPKGGVGRCCEGPATAAGVLGKDTAQAPSGRGWAQDEEDNGEDLGMESYEDDEDDEDQEAGVMAGREPPRCYSCQSLHSGEGCSRVQSCRLSQTVCKTLLSHGDTGSGPLTTYSGWCVDTCQPLTKEVGKILMTVTCCQTTLCNVPPWQGPEGSGAGSPRGPETLATTLLFSLLPGLLGAGS